jgi:hypothetical protein
MTLEASRTTKGDTHLQMAMLILSPKLQPFSATIINQPHSGEHRAKAKMLLYTAWRHIGGSAATAPINLNFSTRWSCVASLRP